MSDRPTKTVARTRWPRLWRLACLALATLILCSCRAPQPVANGPADAGIYQAGMGAAPSMAPVPCGIDLATGLPTVPPQPQYPVRPESWSPPGIACPWPPHEYLCDGGDYGLPARVTHDWQVHGLEIEDTIGHFDTLDGETIVAPSNKVCIYAPRFGSVRSVRSLEVSHLVTGPVGVDLPQGPVGYDEVRIPVSSQQHQQTVAEIGRRQPGAYLAGQGDGQLSEAMLPYGYDDRVSLAERLTFIRDGQYEQTEEASLAAAIEAAIVWSNVQAVQIILDGRQAREEVGVEKAQLTYVVDDPRGPGRLRVCKAASAKTALPGETIEFSIRFDNVGGQVIGNVTIIDSLTPRLEYVEGSAVSSLPGEFFAEPNEAGSLELHWELADPLPSGQGGHVTFRCLVR